MDTLDLARYRCGPIEISVSNRTLLVAGAPTHLRPKTFELLLFLIERRDRLVSKEELLKYVWNDAVVNDNSPARCVIELRKALGDDTRSPRYIRTVPKIGYQFIGALEEEAAPPASAGFPALAPPPPARRRRRLFAVAALLVAATLGIVIARSRTTASDPARHIVLVLPFENQSQSKDLDWLRHGLADLVVTNLAHSPRFRVVTASQSVAQPAAPRLDEAFSLARRLHADAVIGGGFARFGESIRVNAKLYDAKDGRLLHAESVDASTPEKILPQAEELVSELAGDLGERPARRLNVTPARPATRDLRAYRLYTLGVENAHAYHTDLAIEQFRQALALDPGFAMAQARIGYTLAVTTGSPEDGRVYLEKVFRQFQTLSESDRLHIEAWYAIANHDFPLAIRKYRELLARDPGETESYLRLARLLQGEERTAEAIEILKQGLVSDPDSTDLLNYFGQLQSLTGHHDEAIALISRYVALAPEEANSHDSLGLAYAWAGRMAEAEQAFGRALQIQPDFDVALRHMATLEAHTGRYRSAIGRASVLLDHSTNPTTEAWAGSLLVEFLLRTGDVEGARKAAVIVERKEPAMRAQRAYVVLASGDAAQANRIANQLSETRWTNRGGRGAWIREKFFLLGGAAMLDGRSADALADFQEALRHSVSWNDLNFHEDCLADAYLKLGRLDEAIAEYERIVRLFPGMGLAHYHLGSAYLQKGLTSRAASEYRRFLDLWNQADPVSEVLDARVKLNQVH